MNSFCIDWDASAGGLEPERGAGTRLRTMDVQQAIAKHRGTLLGAPGGAVEGNA